MYDPRRITGRGLLLAAAFAVLLAAPALAQYEQGDSRQESIEAKKLASDQAVGRGKLDLNRASLDQIRQLPIPEDVAEAIWEYRTYRNYFGSIYELRRVEGVTPEIIQALLPLVATLPPERQDQWVERYDVSFRQIRRFLSQEGASEELADEYRDLIFEPRDVNALSLFALQSYQNVSPVDATAIVKARERSGLIQSQRQLRSIDGLSYWGYRNLRDYVVYQAPREKWEMHGEVMFQAFNTPYQLDEDELLREPFRDTDVLGYTPNFDEHTAYGVGNLDSANPAMLAKLKLRLGLQWKAGIMTFRNVGERNPTETLKGYVEWHNPRARKYRLDKVVLGNFRVAFGQGLVMDNTDYFLPRKTGRGYNKRPQGLIGDVSRTYEFALRGGAAEATLGDFHVMAFLSDSKKDGILNFDDGEAVSINKYIVSNPRFEDYQYEIMGDPDSLNLRTDIRRSAFDETLFGGALQYQVFPGTFLGISGYEAQHNLPWDPKIETLVQEIDRDEEGRLRDSGRLEPRDAEIFHAYDSRQLGKFRRVVGAEFQTVVDNVAFQGEYAKLDSNPDGSIFSDAPDALVLTGSVQYSGLNLFALFRDYDVGFDNPYARPFAEDNRYEQTLLGDPFRLNSPLYSWLEANTPQNKAERGIFLRTRYQVSRKFTISGLDFDQWKRKADGQSQRRYTARFEYAPIWPIRLRLRQRYSDRAPEELSDNRRFQSWDTRFEVRARLSRWDELRLLYSNTNTQFASRPRLTGPAVPPGDPQGYISNPLPQAAAPSEAIQAMLVHNVTDRLQFTISTQIYDGFLWNFEDSEFIVVDGEGIRSWFVVQSRLSDNLLLRFKLTHDQQRTRNNLETRQFANSDVSESRSGDKRQTTAFRLEFYYNF